MQKNHSLLKILFFFSMSFVIIPFIVFAGENIILQAPDGTSVFIHRDGYGVPHIKGETEIGVFFGQGFAVAQDRLFQMETLRRAAQGKLAEWFGSGYLASDKDALTMYYTEEERQQHFNNLSVEMQQMLEAYRDGVNTYLDSVAAYPSLYKPYELSAFQMEQWSVTKSIAIMEYMARRFGQFGGDELIRLFDLQSHGQEWFDSNKPINDPDAPTTIPGGALFSENDWAYSGMAVRESVIQALVTKREELYVADEALGLPLKFGSFAVLIGREKAQSGNVMLLGCPQMGNPKQNEAQINNEVELWCPSFHVGGINIAGVPSVIIGHTENHAWTLTSGYSDNSDVYIDSTQNDNPNLSLNKYFFNGEWLDFEVIQDTILSAGSSIPFTHYRTVHGPVIGDDVENFQVYSLKMTFWHEELDMLNFLYGVIRAENIEEFQTAAAYNPMSFNLFYAGKNQKIKFWHIGKYQDRSDGVDPRLPHKGDGTEEWGGFLDFSELPVAEDPAQGYFVNWNNKPAVWWNNGDNVPWKATHRVTSINNYVGPKTPFSYDDLKYVPRQISSHGTYQQAVEFADAEIINKNIVPPGQSGFISLKGTPSPHFSDQWNLHINWSYKDMEFGEFASQVFWDELETPEKYSLGQNYPNPFNANTTITYHLPKSTHARLELFNIRGQKIKTIFDEFQEARNYSLSLFLEELNSGIYLYRFEAGNFTDVKKIILLK